MPEFVQVTPRARDELPFFVCLRDPVAGPTDKVVGDLVDAEGRKIGEVAYERKKARNVCRAIRTDDNGLVPV